MKKIAIAAAIAACTVPGMQARAQTAVQIYGIVDAAVEHYTNADAAGHSRTWMPSLGGGMFPSRLGFKGSEYLGGGLKAIFTLENGIQLDTGANGQNRLFGRQAWVGLAGDWGQVTLGRNYNMIYNSMPEFDLSGPSQYGLGSLDPAIPNGRTDNSIAYKGSFKGVTVGATYSLGRDVSNAGGPAGTNCAGENAADAQACREWSAMLRYDGAAWGAVGAYDRKRGGAGAAAGLTASTLSDSRAHGGVYARFGAWKVSGGAVVRDNEGAPAAPRSNLYYLSAAYKLTPALTVDGQLARLDYRNSGNDSKQALLRAMFDFSKRTTVYVAGGRIDNGGSAAVTITAGGSVGAGLAQNALLAGIKHGF
ncbi:porin [Massilia forsythiae]|uniref:Porin n=1 Tax=Massilia forsythiae TaxID=2728020 RepID=A0A7Z2W0G4_9BURK|nr:porin [Massilia forsythiae]QJE02792.1 porin [Massilia forsythiae]